jgi:hypothetical protein
MTPSRFFLHKNLPLSIILSSTTSEVKKPLKANTTRPIGIMYRAQDSLVTLRNLQKRPLPLPEKRKLPFDELKDRVLAKRRRGDGEREQEQPVPQTGKGVRFDLSRNEVINIHRSIEDLREAWMSGEEASRVRSDNFRTINVFRTGQNDYEDCLRGLELHSSPELVTKKVQNGKKYIQCILEQQELLRGIMGKVNEQILGRMSSILSAEDVEDAVHTASLDQNEATVIYRSSMEDTKGQETKRQETKRQVMVVSESEIGSEDQFSDTSSDTVGWL